MCALLLAWLIEVHCRIGSLETDGAIIEYEPDSSLPHRQLRNVRAAPPAAG